LPPQRWLLRAKVEIPNPDLAALYAVDINTGGELGMVGTNALLVSETVTAPGGRSATLVVELIDDNFVTIELIDITGVANAYVGGIFTAILPAGEGDEPVRLPLAGISRSPAGDLYGLSEGEWDPYGAQGLYAITTNGSLVSAARITDLTGPELLAIEFLADGTLLAAGDGLYELDELTGDPTYISTTGIGTNGNLVVDLDDAPNGRLYGTTLDELAPSQLIDLTPGAEPLPPHTLQPEGRHWGLVIHRPKFLVVSHEAISIEGNAR